MQWLIDRLAPPPDLPPPPEDGDAALALRDRLDSLYAHQTDHQIDAAREELSRYKARLAALRLAEIRAQRDGARERAWDG